MACLFAKQQCCQSFLNWILSREGQIQFLHLLKAVRRQRLGDAEIKEFRRIATDSSRRWPIRVYGWAAYVGSTQRYPELMEAARAETIPQLRRGMIANLRGRSRQSFLNHARMNFPESRYMVQWVQAA